MRRTVVSILIAVAVPLAAQAKPPAQSVSHAPAPESASHAPAVGAASHASHWTYEGAEGPQAWGRIDPLWRTCAVGHEQSPIDLGGAVVAHSAPIDERFKPSPFVLFHNGHTVQAALERKSALTAEGLRFESVQFHFHHPSEHTVRGRAYPAELHLVHANAKGELAVLGIFIALGATDNPAIEALIARLPKVSGDSVRFSEPIDLSKLLDAHAGEPEAVFTYHGSLTTPPCSEGVKWTVRSRPITASFRQIQRLVGVLGESARPVQPVYARH
jgi:carbonic anhydrase